MTPIRVYKRDAYGTPILHYDGRLMLRTPQMIQLEAFFGRADVVTPYHTFRQGDRMVEWFFSARWYNIFELYAAEDGRLTGWYCNITHPAHLAADHVSADDLALDVMVYPDGTYTVLDEDEFAALDLDDATRQAARQGLNELLRWVSGREGPFWVLSY